MTTLTLNAVAFYTLLRREWIRIIRIWSQTLLPPVITTSLYFMIFGNLIGPRIGEMGGLPYIDFIFPGLLLMTVITNAYANVSTSFFSTKFQHNIDEILVAPVATVTIILGFVGGGVIRSLLVGTAVTITAAFFIDVRLHSISITVATFMLTAILFSLGGLINALLANNFDGVSIIPTFVLTPLTYLGGVFYSIDLLPPFWEGVSHFNPVLYMINASRYGLLGFSDVPIVVSFLITIAFIVALFSIAYFMIANKIRVRQQ